MLFNIALTAALLSSSFTTLVDAKKPPRQQSPHEVFASSQQQQQQRFSTSPPPSSALPVASSSSSSSFVPLAQAQDCLAHCPMMNLLSHPISSQDHLDKGGLHCGYRSNSSPFPIDCFYSPLGLLLTGPADACSPKAPIGCLADPALTTTGPAAIDANPNDVVLKALSPPASFLPPKREPKDCAAHCPMTNNLLQPIISQDHLAKGGLHCGYKPSNSFHSIDCHYSAHGALTSGPFGACTSQAPMACDIAADNNAQASLASVAQRKSQQTAQIGRPTTSNPSSSTIDNNNNNNITRSPPQKLPTSVKRSFQNRPSSKHSKNIYGPHSFLSRRTFKWL